MLRGWQLVTAHMQQAAVDERRAAGGGRRASGGERAARVAGRWRAAGERRAVGGASLAGSGGDREGGAHPTNWSFERHVTSPSAWLFSMKTLRLVTHWNLTNCRGSVADAPVSSITCVGGRSSVSSKVMDGLLTYSFTVCRQQGSSSKGA